MSSVCQACQLSSVEVEEPADNQEKPYRLCQACHNRLLSYSLRPKEWYNLAKIHGWWMFHLHDDFYDEDGTATQPQHTVIDTALFPCPSLDEVKGSPKTLIEFACTRWHMTEDLILAFKQHPQEQLLVTVFQAWQTASNDGIRGVILDVCGHVLEQMASDFVRERWKYIDSLPFASLAYATARCLPYQEGYTLVMNTLEKMGVKEKRENMFVLSWFRSQDTLNWIERNIQSPVTEDWGRLAATSRMDWNRLKAWLACGRPRSLVALDALKACIRYDTLLLREMKPQIEGDVSVEEIETMLHEYKKRDPAPRIQRNIEEILRQKERLQHSYDRIQGD